MELKNYCISITKQKEESAGTDERLSRRIMCPEYAPDHVDTKSFPSTVKNDVFALCWNVQEGGRLMATIKPYQKAFTYCCSFKRGEKTQYHTHDYIELAYIAWGEFRQRIIGQDILFKRGELCLIDKNCPHQDFMDDKNSVILFIGLANSIFDEVMVENIGEEKLLHFLRMALMKQKDIKQYLHFKPKDPEDVKLEDLLLLLLKELETNDVASGYITKGFVMRILNYISTMYEFNLSREQRRKVNWLTYEEIMEYIDKNYANVTIKDLVDRFHYNKDYYNRILNEKLGVTYQEYVRELRLKNACRLLKTTKLTVDEIARQVGYQNKGFFYKIFVERYQMTPSKMRKNG